MSSAAELSDPIQPGPTADRPYPGGIPEAPQPGFPFTSGRSTPSPSAVPAPSPATRSPRPAGVNSAKLRKDLCHLGSYGIRGSATTWNTSCTRSPGPLASRSAGPSLSSEPATLAARWRTTAVSSPAASGSLPSWTLSRHWSAPSSAGCRSARERTRVGRHQQPVAIGVIAIPPVQPRPCATGLSRSA